MEAADYKAGLAELRSNLALRRGYGSRVANSLNVKKREVYNVAWGRAKNPEILKALVEEAKQGEQQIDPSGEIIKDYLKSVA